MSAGDAADRAVDAALGPAGEDPHSYHDRFRAETRDAGWADATEAAVRRRYLAVPGITPATLQVRCAARLCEVYARFAAAADPGRPDPTMAALQGAGLNADMARLGLASGSQSFGSDTAAPREVAFVGYWTKTG